MNIYLFAIRSLIGLALVLSSLSLKAQSHVLLDPQISSNDITVGDVFCVDFQLQNIELLSSIQFTLEYDESLLSFLNFSSPSLPGFTSSNFNANSESYITVSYEPSVSDYPNGLIIDSDVTAFQVCFEAIAATELTSIAVADEPVDFEVSSNGFLKKVQDSSISFDIIGEETECPFDGIKLELGETCGSSGYNVCIDVFADNFENVVSTQYSIVYDPSVLAFTNAGDFLLPNLFSDNIANPLPGFITVSWFSNDLVEGTSLEGKQKIYELCFDIIDENTGSSSTYLSIGSTPTPMEAISNSLEELDVWRVDGKLEINIPDCDNNGEPVNDLSFNISDYEAVSGGNICIPVTVDGFADIISFQYSINYDPAILNFVGTNLTGFPDFNFSNVANPIPGLLTFSWTSISDLSNGITVSDNTSLFELCFDVVGTEGLTSVDFINNPAIIEIFDNNDQLVSAEFNNGSVSITGQTSEGVTLELSEASGQTGDVVCVDVNAIELDNILSMQFSLDYDETALAYVGIEGINFPDLFTSNVGNPQAGLLTLSWFSNSDLINGASASNGTTLFQICFELIGDEGVYPINFTNGPTNIEFIDAQNDLPIEPVTLVDGEISIGENEEGFTLDLSVESASVGEVVCLDVIATGFNNILSMQYGMEYDPTVLAFNSVDNSNLANLSPANVVNPELGVITTSWFSNNVSTGTSLADGTSVYQVCFDVLDGSGFSAVDFSDDYLVYEITDMSQILTNYTLVDGGVNIETFFNSDIEVGFNTFGKDKLFQNKPNPSTGNTIISFDLEQGGEIQFSLFKENGKLIQTFSNEYTKGRNEIEIDDLHEPGVYYYTISSQNFSLSKRMIVISQ